MNTITSFYKKGLKGFTLIELLVVIAIIGLLSTIIAAPITQARKKGRDGKKVADLRQMVNALQQYADDNSGQYPYALSSLTPKYLSNVPPNAEPTTLAKDKYMYVAYIDSGAVVNNSTGNIGFHLGSKLEATSLALGDDRDCFGIGTVLTTATSTFCIDQKNFTGTASTTAHGSSTTIGNLGSTSFANFAGATNVEYPGVYSGIAWGSGILAASATTTDDFSGGQDVSTTNCDASINGPTACIYDVTN